MTNSDYLLKATIKKVTEKLNEIVVEKFEEASNIAQDVPEKIKKEFDTLKEAIIEEATRMENEFRRIACTSRYLARVSGDILYREERYIVFAGNVFLRVTSCVQHRGPFFSRTSPFRADTVQNGSI